MLKQLLKRGKLSRDSYSFLGYGARLGFGMLTFLVIVRMLSQEAFGVWVLYVTFGTIAEMARNGLIQNGVVKFFKEEDAPRSELVTAGLALSLSATLLFGLVVAALGYLLETYWSAPGLGTLCLWFIGLSLLQAGSRLLEGLFMADGNFRAIFWGKAAFGVTFFLSVLLPWLNGIALPLALIPAGQVLAALLELAVGLGLAKKLPRPGPLVGRRVFRLFRFGRYVMGTNLGSMIFNKVDVLLLGGLLGPAAVGLYNAASRVTNFVEVPLSSMSQVLYPDIAEEHARDTDGNIGRLYEKSIAKLLAVILPPGLLILCFPEMVIQLIAGAAYVPAADILRLLTLSILIKPWGRLFGITLDAIGQPELNFRVLAGSLVLNLVLNVLFIPIWGVEGVALATLITIAANALVGQWLLRRFFVINHLQAVRQTINIYSSFFKLKLLKP